MVLTNEPYDVRRSFIRISLKDDHTVTQV